MDSQEKRTPIITGREGGPIELTLASEWTRNHRERNPGESISQFFGQETLNAILKQEGCQGIRFYYANDQRLNVWQKFWVAVGNFFIRVVGGVGGNQHAIITGVSDDGEDQLPIGGIHTFALCDQSYPCPGSTGCPKNSLTK